MYYGVNYLLNNVQVNVVKNCRERLLLNLLLGKAKRFRFLFYRLLTDMKITDIATAKEAMQKLHTMGAKTVIISSSNLGNQDLLVGLGSSAKSKCEREAHGVIYAMSTVACELPIKYFCIWFL